MAVGINGNICDTSSAALLFDPSEIIWQTGTVTTNSTARTIVVSYLVPAGKDFYIVNYSVSKTSNNDIGAVPSSLEILTPPSTLTIKDSGYAGAGTYGNAAIWGGLNTYGFGIKIATAGQTIRLYVVATGTTSTGWFGKIVGVLRNV